MNVINKKWSKHEVKQQQQEEQNTHENDLKNYVMANANYQSLEWSKALTASGETLSKPIDGEQRHSIERPCAEWQGRH